MNFEIIDFHTHPFMDEGTNISKHKEYCNMSVQGTLDEFKMLGIAKICGSVISTKPLEERGNWESVKKTNDIALELRDIYGDFYIPGFHINPLFLEESYAEIERMHKKGLKLIGELVPLYDGWCDYSMPEFSELLKAAGKHDMILSLHTQGNDEMDKMVKEHKDVKFVAAHPGEYENLMRHIERMKMSENYYLDLSGTGIFRYGSLRRLIDSVGIDRLIFGSDYPACTPGMYVGGVLFDKLLTDTEKEKIFSLNAKKLLGL